MKITWREKEGDPPHPIMVGKTPTAREFNKRQAALWKSGGSKVDFEQVSTVLLEILIDDYDRRYAPFKDAKSKKIKT